MLPDSLVCTRGPKSWWSNRLLLQRPVSPSVPLVITLLVLAPSAANSQAPTFQDVAGHAFGERITVHHEMVRYLERLDETSDRVRLVDQGASWEGRRLLLAIVTSPGNQASLEVIQQNARRLGDPRTLSADEAAALITRQPVVVW